jgi:hypothetical protein
MSASEASEASGATGSSGVCGIYSVPMWRSGVTRPYALALKRTLLPPTVSCHPLRRTGARRQPAGPVNDPRRMTPSARAGTRRPSPRRRASRRPAGRPHARLPAASSGGPWCAMELGSGASLRYSPLARTTRRAILALARLPPCMRIRARHARCAELE